MALNPLRPSPYGKDSSLSSALGAAYNAVAPPDMNPTAPGSAPSQGTQPPPAQPATPSLGPGYGTQGTSTPSAPATPTLPGETSLIGHLAGRGNGLAGVFDNSDKKAGYYDGLTDPADIADMQAYTQFLRSMPKYKGSDAAIRAAILLHKQQLIQNRRDSGALDDHAIASLGDNYNALDDQLGSQLAAMGVNGPALAGAHSNLRGKENAAIGEYWAQANEQRRKELLAQRMAELGYNQQMIQMALQRYQQEHQGGFLHDLIGVAGTIGGALIGGPVGAAVGAGAGSFAGGQSGGSPGYGNASMGGYGPPDPNGYYGPWQPSGGA